MLVNGVQEKLKGMCLHQDAGSLGVAVPVGVWQERLKKLKDMGCNAIRPSHHPFAPEFYDLCDKMGFYVWMRHLMNGTRDIPGEQPKIPMEKRLMDIISILTNGQKPTCEGWCVATETTRLSSCTVSEMRSQTNAPRMVRASEKATGYLSQRGPDAFGYFGG
jgi:hypothetical protein